MTQPAFKPKSFVPPTSSSAPSATAISTPVAYAPDTLKNAGGGRRRVPRRVFHAPVGLLVGGEYRLEQAFQVGEGGLLVSSAIDLAAGRMVVVSFYMFGVTVIVRGVVRNIMPPEGEFPIRYGLEFRNLEFQYKREIRNFVASANADEVV